MRSYLYHPNSGGALWAVLNEAGTAVAEFAYDESWRAISVVDSGSTVLVAYGTDGSATVTEYFHGPEGETSATSVRTLDEQLRVTSISDGCACGPARQLTWSSDGLACSIDGEGHIQYTQYDSAGQVTRRVSYTGAGCPATASGVPTTLPVDSTDETYVYSASARREVAQGVWLDLDRVKDVKRTGIVLSSYPIVETSDYGQAPAAGDPAGYTCAAQPLPAGSVVCRTITTGRYETFSTRIVERFGTFYSYDSRGRLARTYGPVDLDSPSPSDIVPLEERTYWADDALPERRGRLREVKRYASPSSAPLVTAYDYDAFGASQITDPNGGVTMISRDGRGRPRFVTAADGAVTETRYYDELLPRVVILPSGAAIRSSYDTKGRLALVERFSSDPDVAGELARLGWSEANSYDAAGNRVRSERRDGRGIVTWSRELAFDVHHRIVKDTNPESPSTSRTWSFDDAGALTRTVDEESRAVTYALDGIGRPTRVTRSGVDRLGQPVSLDAAVYGYKNADPAAISVTDGKGRKTDYLHDDFGRLMKMKTPAQLWANNDIWFTYDARGNLLKREDGGAATYEYKYDGLDRLVSMTARDVTGAAVTYSYRYDEGQNGLGRLTSIVEADRTVRLSYDLAGRLQSERVEESGVTAPLVTGYEYDADGAVRTVMYPSGLVVAFDRDAATGEVIAVRTGDGTRTFADQIAYAPAGPITALKFGNGLTLSHVLDLRYEPLEIASGPVALTYVPSPAGDVSAIDDGSGVARSFSYDFMDRLLGSGDWAAYGYDGAGNRTTEMLDGIAAQYTYTYDRVKERYEGSVRTHGFAYDHLSGLSAVIRYNATGAVVRTYCLLHDPLRRLVAVGRTTLGVPPGAGGWCTKEADLATPYQRFKYDSRNRRVARVEIATGKTTHWVFDQAGNPLAELVRPATADGAWTVSREYVWLAGRPLAQIEHPGPAGAAAGYVYYVHTDHIGLPRALTNQSGQTVWSAQAKPYGELVETTTTDPLSGRTVVTNLRLPGQYDERLLGPVGLQGPYYNWNRWYLPGVGRYLELDPIATAGGFNGEFGPDWYSYANQNPLRYTDPTGAEACEIPDPCADEMGVPPSWFPDWLPRKRDYLECQKKMKKCEEQYSVDLATCNGVSRARGPQAAARCFSSAMARKVACERGFPLPPLDVWNN